MGLPAKTGDRTGAALPVNGVRQHYIDNLRSLCILLLFPVHTFMIWNDFGSGFYIWMGEGKVLSTLIVLINPWFMPLLFVLAGMSAGYALEKRSVKEFVRQRTEKLLVPFVVGVLLLVPFQALYARKYFDHYNGSLWEHWRYFFSHVTDLSGYDGAFTPGQLWFILFLYIISMVSLVLFRYLPREKVFRVTERLPVFGIVLLFIPIWVMYYIGNFGGFSIGKSMALYLMGYYVLGNDAVIQKIDRKIKWLVPLSIAGTAASGLLYYDFSFYGDLWVCYIGWSTLLVLLVLGKRYINKRTRFTEYMNRASYPVYILHQTVLVAVAYYAVQIFDIMVVQVTGICIGSLLLTLLAYHIITIGDES